MSGISLKPFVIHSVHIQGHNSVFKKLSVYRRIRIRHSPPVVHQHAILLIGKAVRVDRIQNRLILSEPIAFAVQEIILVKLVRIGQKPFPDVFFYVALVRFPHRNFGFRLPDLPGNLHSKVGIKQKGGHEFKILLIRRIVPDVNPARILLQPEQIAPDAFVLRG
ncbi:hypothetical protein D3C81_1560060 [compost metagenome]